MSFGISLETVSVSVPVVLVLQGPGLHQLEEPGRHHSPRRSNHRARGSRRGGTRWRSSQPSRVGLFGGPEIHSTMHDKCNYRASSQVVSERGKGGEDPQGSNVCRDRGAR